MVDSAESNVRERLESLAEFLDCPVGDLLPSIALGGSPASRVEPEPNLELGNGLATSCDARGCAPSLSASPSHQGGCAHSSPRPCPSFCAGPPPQVTMLEGSASKACADPPGERLLEAPASVGWEAGACATTVALEGCEETLPPPPLSPLAPREDTQGPSAAPSPVSQKEEPQKCASSPGSSASWQRSFSDDAKEDPGARREDDWEVI